MSTGLQARVVDCIVGVPHRPNCATVEGVAGEYHFIPGDCSCDRDERIALQVVEMVNRGMWCRFSHGHEFNWDAALRAHAGSAP